MPPKRVAGGRSTSAPAEAGEASRRDARLSPLPEAQQEEEEALGTQGDPDEGVSVRDGADTPAPSILEDLLAEKEALEEQIREKRLREELINLRLEAGGTTPTQYVEVSGTQLPNRKRAASSQEAPASLKQLKLATPPTFDGKSIRGLQNYDVGWKAHFKAMPRVASDAYAGRIAHAATYLTGIAIQAWVREDKEYDTWEDYIKFLRSTVADPATRKSEALLSLAAKKQGPSQSVRDLLAEIEQLEEDIPKMSEDERKAWVLLNALSPALRAEVIRENKEITSREQVLASAQRHEEITKSRVKAESFRPPLATTTTTRRWTPATSSRVAANPPKPNPNERRREPFGGECYNCGKKGHRKQDCRSAKKRSPSPKGMEKSKN